MSIDIRRTLSTLTAMRPLQDALELVSEEGALDDLDKSRKLCDRLFPYSCTDEEGLVLSHVIRANGLRSGFEVATAFGYSTAYLGLALQENGGSLVTMDCYVEEWKESYNYDPEEVEVAVAAVLEDVGRGVLPAGLRFADEQLTALGLEEDVTLSIGVSPASVPDALRGRAVDVVLIDGGHFGEQPTLDYFAVAPYLTDQCAVFFHDNNDNPAVENAVAFAERHLGADAVVFPTRYRLTLVGRGLDPQSVKDVEKLLLRCRRPVGA